MSAFINEKTLKLSETVGFTLFSVFFSFITTLILKFSIDHSAFHYLNKLNNEIKLLKFQDIILNYFIGFLLFATTLNMNVIKLKEVAKTISYLATVGVIISAFLTGGLLFYLSNYIFNLNITVGVCLIFGALISPTDPIAVLSVLKNNKNIPKNMQNTILGESLFNDATGILLLTILTTVFIKSGVISDNFSLDNIGYIYKMIFNEIILTLLLTFSISFIVGNFILKMTHNSSTALMISLLCSFATYYICNTYHLSAPLAMVVLGLTLGHFLRLSKVENRKVTDFWNVIESLLNSCLFVLIGLKILTIDINLLWLSIGLIVIILIIISRYISIIIPSFFIKNHGDGIKNKNKKAILMTLGGVRGGISLALALSIKELPDIIIYITYSVVLISIVVQSYAFEIYCKKTKIYWD